MTEFPCLIRKARSEDAGHLSDLAFRSKAYWGYPREFMDACRAELTYTLDDVNLHHFYVAEINRSPLGFYALKQLSTDRAELEALFVEPTYVRQGVGRILIEHAKSVAVELGINLIVIQGDPNASDFYRSVGAVQTGEEESKSIPGRYLPTFTIRIGTTEHL